MGQVYEEIRQNIWGNQYLRDMQGHLLDTGVDFEINYEKVNKDIISMPMLFNDNVMKK